MYEVLDRKIFDEGDEKIVALRPKNKAKTKLALVGGFTPRRCGIATFTADSHAALLDAAPDLAIDVYAMTPTAAHVPFDPAVCGTIVQGDPDSYADIADRINASCANVVWLQHEFGLFGGRSGDMVFELIDRVAAPLVVTLHTVLSDPDADQMRVMRRLIARASKLVVMSERSRALLRSTYVADDDQIAVIEHGVPDRPFGRSQKFKSQYGFTGRDLLMTFGLLSPGKGIEAVIEAMPAMIAAHPNLLYCIVGATHPNLLEREGEAYRDRLRAQAAALGVDDHIHWIDAFLDTDELLDLIEAADIYVTPYTGAGQSTSGTLSYAVALGKAVVSTPYDHAAELLADDHGVLVPFNDSAALAREIGDLLASPDRLLALQKRAYDRGRQMIWPAFAERSHDLIRATAITSAAAPIPAKIGVEGLLRICDDTGIIQHSVHNVPDRAHGYCVDDNARALMLMNRIDPAILADRDRWAAIFAGFVQNAWNGDHAKFRNFMGYGRNWLEEFGSEDSCGRTIWALGATARHGQSSSLRAWAGDLFDRTAASALQFTAPRAMAFAMLGADCRAATDADHAVAHRILREGAERLQAKYAAARRPDWNWFEGVLAYDNCRLSEAMIRAGMRLERSDHADCGIETLRWITDVQTAATGHFRPVGSDSFGRGYALPLPFDQQPVEIWAAIDAASAAFDQTGDAIWRADAQRAYAWFSGANDRGVAVADSVTGTCCDGINPHGVNRNEGAESVLAYQLATYAIRDFIAKGG